MKPKFKLNVSPKKQERLLNRAIRDNKKKGFLKIMGETKHFLPANKEWRDSVYSFNNNNLKLIPHNNNRLDTLIRSYFYLNDTKDLARSRRMRSSLNKNITKIFISKPEVKHASDKAIVTLYVYNKEREDFLRKIFLLSKNAIIKSLTGKNVITISNTLKNKITGKIPVKLNRKFTKNVNTSLRNKLTISRSINSSKYLFGMKNINNMKMLYLLYKNYINSNRFKLLRSKFYFFFLRYILSFVDIKIKLAKSTSVFNENKIALYVYNKKNIIAMDTFGYNNETEVFNKVNLKLFQFVELIVFNNKTLKERFSFLLLKYYNEYYDKYIIKHLEHDTLLAHNYMKFLINQFKFEKFLPAVKNLIGIIYNKKIELNLVKLKYRYLNSDILVESMANKLRKRIGVLTALDSNIKLVKTPYKFIFRNDKYDINKFDKLNFFRSFKMSNLQKHIHNKDMLSTTIDKIYPYNISHDHNNYIKNINLIRDNKILDVLNTIKYKWVTGVRLELKGRLTRRYTASRSLFKLKIKGNLSNIDFSRKTDKINKHIPNVMVRNQAKSNLQYSFAESKRRIGAFGVKGWISSY